MAKSNVKSISFKEFYDAQYEYLIKQENPSQFVCELIKKHMENENNFESRVEEIVSNYIEKNFKLLSQVVNMQPSNNIIESPIEDDRIDAIEDPW